MTRVDESQLPPDVRRGLEQLRACDNVASCEVQSVSAEGAYCIMVPTDAVGEGGGWGMPNEPFLFLIPHKAH